MFQELIAPLALLVVVVALAFLYVIAIENRQQRDKDEAENIRRGFQKISRDGPFPS